MWKTDISFTRICGTKEMHLYNNNKAITIYVPTLYQRIFDADISFFYNIINMSLEDFKKNVPIKGETQWEVLSQLLLNPLWTNMKETKLFRIKFENAWKTLMPGYLIDETRQLSVDSFIVDELLWKWIVYIFKYADSSNNLLRPDMENEITLKQQQYAEKIKKIKQKAAEKTGDTDDLMRTFILIQYAFPNISTNELWQKTMNEIQWLKQIAQKAVNYEIEKLIYTSGNSKKKKLEFFLKK